MTVVNSKEFATNHEKYFDLALDEQVYIKKGDYMFHIICSNFDTVNVKKQPVLEPDDDLRSGITKEEFKERAHEIVHNFFANQ
jgi:hypothetical protein